MIKKIFSLVLTLWTGQIIAQSVSYSVVHTGVSEFYDEGKIISTPLETNSLYWQDAGRVINSPDYTDNGDGTITDKVTGLMWQQDMGDKITYAEATIKAESLEFGDYKDWRIPTIKELYSLILFTGQLKGENANKLFIDTNYFHQPLGDTSIGEREIDGQTWSSTHYTGLTMNSDSTVFGVNFVDGRIKGYPKYKRRGNTPNAMYFRMVRGNLNYGVNDFSDNNDGTITDNATGLMWQKADDGEGLDWLNALSYCEDLELGGYSDWHLPNAKELQSIVDYTRSPEKTASAAIDPIFEITEINDPEGNPGHYPFFWSSSTHLDGANPYSGAAYIAFGKALGKMNDELMDVHGAGAQRSDPKIVEEGEVYPMYKGPQGDLRMVLNHCRCVRYIESTSDIKDENQEYKIKIYPNPAQSYITVETIGSSHISIIDLTGKIVYNAKVVKNLEQINIDGLQKGVYILKLSNNETRLRRKLAVE